MHNEKHREICKEVTSGGNIDKRFSIKEDLLDFRNWISVLEACNNESLAQHATRE
jgi:hypothetical protein